MDYTQIIDDFKNTQEFKDFLSITGGKVISSDRQAKNGTIQIGNLESKKAWGLFSNGYVRESFYGPSPWGNNKKIEVDTHSNILRRPQDISSPVNVDFYTSGLSIILSRFKKRDDLYNKRLERLNSNTKMQKIAIHSLFDRKSVEYYDEYHKVWNVGEPYYGIEDWDWDRILETLSNPKYHRTHRIKQN